MRRIRCKNNCKRANEIRYIRIQKYYYNLAINTYCFHIYIYIVTNKKEW